MIMTIKELYDSAKKNKVEHYEIKLQYQDGGGYTKEVLLWKILKLMMMLKKLYCIKC